VYLDGEVAKQRDRRGTATPDRIILRRETKDELDRLRRPGDTADHIVQRLLRFHRRYRAVVEGKLVEENLP
jgi:hypothetical protein